MRQRRSALCRNEALPIFALNSGLGRLVLGAVDAKVSIAERGIDEAQWCGLASAECAKGLKYRHVTHMRCAGMSPFSCSARMIFTSEHTECFA